MKLFALAPLISLLLVSAGSAAPVIPGLSKMPPSDGDVVGPSKKHPLSETEVGDLLIGELKCAACHTRKGAAALERAAPDLTDAGSRVSPEFLLRFIQSPASAHAGTTMPDLLASEPAEEREKIAEALTHFLIAQSPRSFEGQAVVEKEAMAGTGEDGRQRHEVESGRGDPRPVRVAVWPGRCARNRRGRRISKAKRRSKQSAPGPTC